MACFRTDGKRVTIPSNSGHRFWYYSKLQTRQQRRLGHNPFRFRSFILSRIFGAIRRRARSHNPFLLGHSFWFKTDFKSVGFDDDWSQSLPIQVTDSDIFELAFQKINTGPAWSQSLPIQVINSESWSGTYLFSLGTFGHNPFQFRLAIMIDAMQRWGLAFKAVTITCD